MLFFFFLSSPCLDRIPDHNHFGVAWKLKIIFRWGAIPPNLFCFNIGTAPNSWQSDEYSNALQYGGYIETHPYFFYLSWYLWMSFSCFHIPVKCFWLWLLGSGHINKLLFFLFFFWVKWVILMFLSRFFSFLHTVLVFSQTNLVTLLNWSICIFWLIFFLVKSLGFMDNKFLACALFLLGPSHTCLFCFCFFTFEYNLLSVFFLLWFMRKVLLVHGMRFPISVLLGDNHHYMSLSLSSWL